MVAAPSRPRNLDPASHPLHAGSGAGNGCYIAPPMSTRVLVTGAAGNVGHAVVRHLIEDARYEVHGADQREFPPWIRECCETHTGDLRDTEEARAATRGCSHVIHLAAIVGGIGNFHKFAYTLTERNAALNNAVFRAALELEV